MFKTTPNVGANQSLGAFEQVDFSIAGMRNAADPTEGVIAILIDHETPDEKTKAVMFEDWQEVLDVVATLLQSATKLWGPPPAADDGAMAVIELELPKGH